MSYRRSQAQDSFIVFRKGTRRAVAENAQNTALTAARGLANFMKPALGPRGMNKLLITDTKDIIITRDGARMLSFMEFSHPIAWILKDATMSIEKNVGDGSKTTIIIAGELVKRLASLVKPGESRICAYVSECKFALELALERLRKLAKPFEFGDYETMINIAKTMLNARGIELAVDHLADLAVRAVLNVTEKREGRIYLNPDDVQIMKKHAGSLFDSELILGAVIDRSSDRGIMHLLMPKKVHNVKVALINTAIKPMDKFKRMQLYEREIIIRESKLMGDILKEQEGIAIELAEKIISTGAGAVFSKRPIHPTTAYELAKAGIPAVERLTSTKRVELIAKATGANPVTSLDNLKTEDLGWATLVEERKIGKDQVIVVEGGERSRVVTILLKGSLERQLDEAEHALKDLIMGFAALTKEPAYVPGGGAIEEAISFYLTREASKQPNRRQVAMYAFASALE
ncbi:MAG: hypothetical protein NZ918_04485, partial [Aigarchaeota archaeon]|nr:hypothetical protein [Aigarchaeota archaeon]